MLSSAFFGVLFEILLKLLFTREKERATPNSGLRTALCRYTFERAQGNKDCCAERGIVICGDFVRDCDASAKPSAREFMEHHHTDCPATRSTSSAVAPTPCTCKSSTSAESKETQVNPSTMAAQLRLAKDTLRQTARIEERAKALLNDCKVLLKKLDDVDVQIQVERDKRVQECHESGESEARWLGIYASARVAVHILRRTVEKIKLLNITQINTQLERALEHSAQDFLQCCGSLAGTSVNVACAALFVFGTDKHFRSLMEAHICDLVLHLEAHLSNAACGASNVALTAIIAECACQTLGECQSIDYKIWEQHYENMFHAFSAVKDNPSLSPFQPPEKERTMAAALKKVFEAFSGQGLSEDDLCPVIPGPPSVSSSNPASLSSSSPATGQL